MKKFTILLLLVFLAGCAAPTIQEIRGTEGERIDIIISGNYEDIARCVRDAFISKTQIYGFGRQDVSIAIFPKSGLAEVIPTLSNGAIEAVYEIRQMESMYQSAVTIYRAKSHGDLIMLPSQPTEYYAGIATGCGKDR